MSDLLPRHPLLPKTAATALFVFLFLCAPLLLNGCAGARPAPLPAVRIAAVEANQRGVAKESAGDHDAALADFAEALRLYSSVEHKKGMTVSLLNIARTYRLKGDLPSARLALQRALSLDEKELLSELLFEESKLALAGGELAQAEAAARSALAVPGGEGEGRRGNLLALILFKKGADQEAGDTARLALKQSRDAGGKGEEANALRLLGELSLRKGGAGEGAQYFAQALLLDKERGVGKKIADDLRALGKASTMRGDDAGAIGYYERACAVSRSGSDFSSAACDLERLAEIYDRMGHSKLAEEKRREGKKLPPCLR